MFPRLPAWQRPGLALATFALSACASLPAQPPAPDTVPAIPASIESPASAAPATQPEPAIAAAPEPAPQAAADPLAGLDGLSTLACQSEGVLVAGQVPAELVYRCEGLSAGLTLAALREAGWQLERLGIGARAEHEGELGLPLSLTLRRRP